MADEELKITVTDSNSEGMKAFANIVDPVNLNILIDRLKLETDEENIDEIVQNFLEGC